MSSDTGDDRTRVHAESLQTVASTLASGVAGQLSQPLRELRENLAMMVETIEHYMAEAPGPTPYPWKSLHALRQELAQAYLLSREVARLVGDLHEGMAGAEGAMQPVEVNICVESALNLARHRLSSHTEVFMDLGSLPPVRAVHGELVLAIAKLILCCADSAATREGSAVSIKTHCERGAIDSVVISVADNGAGLPVAAAAAEHVVAPVVRGWGGTFEGISKPGRGSAFEFHLPAISADALDRVASSGSEG
jgi:C4-dicarboxylate-specific signal transduction histidine kinase